MATTTSKLGLQLPDDGEAGWGAMYRANFSKLDQNASGQNLVKPVAGGTYALSVTESANDSYEFNGVLTSNQIVVFPNNMPPIAIENLTTGAFTLGIKTALGAIVYVPQGELLMVYANGTNIEAINMRGIIQLVSATTTVVWLNPTPVLLGTIMAKSGNNIVIMGNSSVSVVQPGLYRIIGTIGGVCTAVAQTLMVQLQCNGIALAPKAIDQNPAAVATNLNASVDAVVLLAANDVISLVASGSVAAGVTLGIGQSSLIIEKVN